MVFPSHNLGTIGSNLYPYVVRPSEPASGSTQWEIVIWPGARSEHHQEATVIERFDKKRPAVDRAVEMAENQGRLGVIVMKNKRNVGASYQKFIPSDPFFLTATGDRMVY